jgi:hypothetical protein
MLKSEFSFRAKPALGVRASDTSDLSMVGYLIELVCDQSLFGATIRKRQPPSGSFS